MTPAHALKIESGQIANHLSLRPLVSLNDHDDTEGPLALSALRLQSPLSFEWSVPWRGTIFHIGIHDVPAPRVTELTARLLSVTERFGNLIREIATLQDTLIVFNHPIRDECGAGTSYHRERAIEFLREYRPRLHAIGINGMRN